LGSIFACLLKKWTAPVGRSFPLLHSGCESTGTGQIGKPPVPIVINSINHSYHFMDTYQLIADSGATKTTWCLLGAGKQTRFHTQGLSPYFLSHAQVTDILEKELRPQLPEVQINEIHFYGTGCSEEEKQDIIVTGIRHAFKDTASIEVASDMLGAARAVCGHEPGVVGILGTGSNSCFFNGKKIEKNNPAPGFILGDEGSGAYLGRKVIQYFIYQTFDEELMHKFRVKFDITYPEILERVYKGQWPNRFLASFAPFLSENRGHYMVENIIEDGICDFFTTHLYKYAETWTMPIHFCGSIALHFKDVVQDICSSAELQLGRVLKEPMEGLVEFHGG
jgi:glucosamine kinase